MDHSHVAVHLKLGGIEIRLDGRINVPEIIYMALN